MLGDDRWRQLRELGTLRSYRPGGSLLREGERGGFLLVLTSGRAKVLGGTEEGGSVLLSLRAAGDLVGEMATASGVRSATVEAIDRCTACYVPRESFEHFLHRHEVQGVFADYLASKLSETVPYQVQQVHFGPGQRLARLLVELVALAGPELPDPLRIPLSQGALASALGMARSTVAERIAEFRAGGALAPGPRLRVDDLNALARHASVSLKL